MTPENAKPAVKIRFALPCEALRPYITTYYRTDVVTSPSEPWIEDWLHPEWANLRFLSLGLGEAAIGNGPLEHSPPFAVTGPTSRAARFRLRTGRSWGIGLMPLGWASLLRSEARSYADRVVDGMQDPAFAMFHPLAEALLAKDGDFAEELALIEAHMEGLAWKHRRNTDAIHAMNAALVDPDIVTVAGLSERLSMNVRTVERLALSVFGFPPKLLLRRQRFLRSLAQFMLDPSMKWLNALDYRYHDQAHFVRDFKRFMGMSPSAYAKLDKPLLIAAAQARMAIAGKAVQGLHDPDASG